MRSAWNVRPSKRRSQATSPVGARTSPGGEAGAAGVGVAADDATDVGVSEPDGVGDGPASSVAPRGSATINAATPSKARPTSAQVHDRGPRGAGSGAYRAPTNASANAPALA